MRLTNRYSSDKSKPRNQRAISQTVDGSKQSQITSLWLSVIAGDLAWIVKALKIMSVKPGPRFGERTIPLLLKYNDEPIRFLVLVLKEIILKGFQDKKKTGMN